jgi:hypothetical protein
MTQVLGEHTAEVHVEPGLPEGEPMPEGEPEPEPGEAEPAEPEPDDDDDEAEHAEPGEVDDDAEPGDDDDGPEAVAAGPSEADIERAFRSLEGRAKRYTAGVNDLLSDTGAPFVPCAVCAAGVPGYIIDPRVEPLSEVAEAAMRALLGIGQEPPFANDPDTEECPRCEGWGRTRTRSKVDGKRLQVCRQCNGDGFIGPPRDLLPSEVGDLPNMAHEFVQPDNEPPPDVDSWGTPRGHREFGMAPNFRDPGWQERIAAYTAGEPAPLPA